MKHFKKLRKFRKSLFPYFLGAVVALIPIVVLTIRHSDVAKAGSLIALNEGYGTTVTDDGNSVTGTITGASWKTSDLCRRDKCLYFDGSSWISFGDEDTYDFVAATDFTIQFWFRSGSASAAEVLVQKYESTGGDGGYRIQMESDGDISFGVDDANGDFADDTVTSTTANYDNNRWHHVSAVKDGTTGIYLYIDGVLVASDETIGSTGTLANGDTLYIGDSNGSNDEDEFVGFIDEIKIYTTEARTQDEIKTDYAGTNPDRGTAAAFGQDKSFLSDGLVGYWKLDESNGNASDSSGNSTTLTNIATVTYTSGKFGNSGDFESGNTEYFQAVTSGSLSAPTVLNDSSNDEAASTTITTASVDPTVGKKLLIFAHAERENSNNAFNWSISASAGVTPTLIKETPDAYPWNGQNNYAAAAALFELDVSTSGSRTFTIDPDSATGHDYIISYIVLEVDDVDFAQNIVADGAELGGGNSESDSISLGSSPVDGNQVIVFAGTSNDDTGATSVPTNYTSLVNQSQTYTSAGAFYRDDTTTASVTFTDFGQTVGNWTGFILELESPPPASTLDLTQSFSINAWINPESNTASTQYNIAGKWDSGSEGYLLAQYGDEIRLYIDSASVYATTDSVNLSTGTWYHIVGIYNSQAQEIKIYVDGVVAPVTTTGTVPSSISNTGARFHIGAANSAGTADNFYDGLIDEVRIYNRILSTDELASLNTWTPGPIAYWRFDENTGTTAYDNSGNGLALTGSAGTIVEAVARTGSATVIQDNSNTGTQAIEAPGDADGIVVMTGGWNNGDTNMFADGIVSWDEASLGSVRQQTDDTGSSENTSALWAAEISTTGTANFEWDWQGTDTVDEGGAIFVFFVKNVDWTSPIRDSGGDNHGNSNDTLSVDPLTGVENDLTVAVHAKFGSDSFSWTGATQIGSSIDYNSDLISIAEVAPTGSHSISINDADNYQALSVIVLAGEGEGDDLDLTAPSWANGKFGNAVQLDGVDEGLTHAYDSSFDFGTGGFSISGWIKASSSGSGTEYILSRYDDDQGYKIWLDSSGYANFGIDDDSTWSADDTVTSSVNLRDDSWHHVAAVKTASSILLYVDGILVDTDISLSETGTLTSNSANLVIGADAPTSANYFEGGLDDFKVYNYARTSSQIVQDMNGGHPVGGSPIASQIGYFKFDEMHGDTAHDSGYGSNHGDLEGSCPGVSTCPTWTNTSKINGALYFDDGDAITIPDGSDYSTDTFTVSAWINRDSSSSGDNDFIVDNRDANNDGWVLLVDPSPDTLLCSYNGIDVTGNTTLETDTWYHVACIADGTNVKVYVDGIEDGSETQSGSISESVNAVIGARSFSGFDHQFRGYMDEVKIYTTALTEKQLQIDMNAGSQASLGGVLGNSEASTLSDGAGNPPVGYWDFNENTGTSTVYDKSGNGNDGTMNGSMTESGWVPGKYGSALEFDGSDDFIDMNDPADGSLDMGTSDFTVSYWAKHLDSSSGDSQVSKRPNGSGIGWSVGLGDVDGRMRFRIEDIDSAAASDISSTNYMDGAWHHYVYVFDRDGNVSGYADGSLTGTVDISSEASSIDNSFSFNINSYSDSSANASANVIMDEVKVWDYALTSIHVAYEYNRGKPLGYWKLDECSGTVAYDLSGNGNNGSIVEGGSGTNNGGVGSCDSGNGNEMWDNGTTGKFNGSLHFDSTDDRVNVGDIADLELTGAMTLSAWVKTPEDSIGTVFSKMGDNGFRGYQIFFVSTPALRFAISSDSTTTYITEYQYTWTDTWQHIAATYDPSTETAIYINGKKVASRTDSVPASQYTNNGQDFLIGARDGGTPNYFDGQIDDVRIYNYVLSEAQIQNVMNLGSVSFRPSEGSPD